MSVNLKKVKAVVKSVQPKVKVSKTGVDKIGVVKLALDIPDGPAFLKELQRTSLKMWPAGVGLYVAVPQPEEGLRVTVKSGKHTATVEMDGRLSMLVQPEDRLSVELVLKGHMTDKAATSLWAIQVDGSAEVDIETMQESI